jgi:putative spermidine/putrescine transport system ATP-binding protein
VSDGWVVEGVEISLDRFHLGPVDLAVRPGEAVAVLGPSGAGKTTLLRTLAGFLPLSAGRVLRDGTDVSDWPPEARALGYVPQGLGLLPHRTVAGNVRFPLDVRGRSDASDRTRELLAKFRLSDLANRYPARLSGGEQQRVALARALAAEPSLIVWDEPWQGLDVLARHELGFVLHDLREVERVPIVVVTHDPALAFSVADSFLVLRDGRVRARGDANAMLGSPVDAFVARFVGFDNVFEPRELDGGVAGGLRDWLSRRAGPEGLAFAAPTVPPIAAGGPPWEGRVRSARPNPSGVAVEVDSDGLVVSLRLAPSGTVPLPTVGSRVVFHVEPAAVHALGARLKASEASRVRPSVGTPASP